MERAFIAGVNFSGRSGMLRASLQREPGRTFFVGPYAEAALSGLSSTVTDEIAIYARRPEDGAFAPLDWAALAARKPATLSGGEQVLLALHCFSRSEYRRIGIDTALEQLDTNNRATALTYLGAEAHGSGHERDRLSTEARFGVILIDNRLTSLPQDWERCQANGNATGHAVDFAGIVAALRPRDAPSITIENLRFSYKSGRPIFHDVALSLEPRTAYRLVGPNGAGKTTLFKLLVGVLKPTRGIIRLDDAVCAPWRSGNRVFALATQNPDHQWCGATLAEDLARRCRALAAADITAPAQGLLASLAVRLGAATGDQLLYELPLAARKRLSWLWPISGAMPWLMLDEPTIGQDNETRAGLATIVARLCELGHGVVLVTHDDDFAARLPHRTLRIEDQTIREP